MNYKIKIKNVHFIEIDVKKITDEDYIVIYRLIKEHKRSFFEEDIKQKIILAYEAFFYFLSEEDYHKSSFIKNEITSIKLEKYHNRVYGKFK